MAAGDSSSLIVDGLSESSTRFKLEPIEGWLDVSRGKKELSMTKEQPRQVMEMIERSEPRGRREGVTRTKAMAVMAPVKAKNSRSRLRLLPAV